MNAIRVHEFGGPEVMKLEAVPDPTPGDGEVVVRTHAIGVNPVDTYLRAGQYASLPELPYTPGRDAAGTVEAVGGGVRRFRAGDRVWVAGTLSGAYAEMVLCREAQVQPLPDGTAWEQGAAMGVPYATAYRALFQRGRARPAETVLIHGATGGVGSAAVQLARAAGLTVYGTGGTEEGREMVREQGADEAFDHYADGYLDRIREATERRGVDVILEMLANVNLGRDLGLLAKHGRVVVIGSRGPVEINPRDLMGRDADIRGMSLLVAPEDELAEAHAALVAGLRNGTLRPIIGERIPLAEAPRAHRAVMEDGAFGKIVLVP